jgi:hypothetical protein
VLSACEAPKRRVLSTYVNPAKNRAAVVIGKSLESESCAAFTRYNFLTLAGRSLNHAVWFPPLQPAHFLSVAYVLAACVRRIFFFIESAFLRV